MKILCGTDFSEHAVEAGRVAGILATRARGKVALVHAMDVSRYELPSKELLDYLRTSRKEKLKLEANRLRHRGAEIEEAFVEGSPAGSLVSEASKSGADLIVVGSLGRVAPRGWRVGSVAERAAQGSSIPILVVRDPKPFETWTHGKQPLHVVVGYDFTATQSGSPPLGSVTARPWAVVLPVLVLGLGRPQPVWASPTPRQHTTGRRRFRSSWNGTSERDARRFSAR